MNMKVTSNRLAFSSLSNILTSNYSGFSQKLGENVNKYTMDFSLSIIAKYT